MTNNKIIKKLSNRNSFNIVCIGNSITWGHVITSYIDNKPTKDNYPFNLEKKLRRIYKNNNINVYNEGHYGFTVEDFLKKPSFLKNVKEKKPDICIIMFGIIEVIRFPRVSISNYIKGLDILIEKIKNIGSEVILLSPTPIFIFDKKLSLYSKKTIDFAIDKKINFIDMREEVYCYMNNNNLTKWDILKIDNVHFRSERYKIISDIVVNKFFKK